MFGIGHRDGDSVPWRTVIDLPEATRISRSSVARRIGGPTDGGAMESMWSLLAVRFKNVHDVVSHFFFFFPFLLPFHFF